jgi:hypothetical protein
MILLVTGDGFTLRWHSPFTEPATLGYFGTEGSGLLALAWMIFLKFGFWVEHLLFFLFAWVIGKASLPLAASADVLPAGWL